MTPNKNIREVLKYIGIKPQDRIYDLGCGIGRVLIVGVKEFGANVSGFEISPILYFTAKINLWAHGVKNFELKRGNFYKNNLNPADAVYCFLSIEEMEKIKPKLEKELRLGTWVLSYAFPVKGWQAEKVFDFNNPGKMYVYRR